MADHEQMYIGWQHGRAPSNEWIDHTTQFLDRAFSNPGLVEGDTIKCPCVMCRNYCRHNRCTVELYLSKYGFRENYQTWTTHGESLVVRHDEFNESNQTDNMLGDLAGDHQPAIDEEPNASAQAFYRMVASADELVHENTTYSCLSAVARLLAMKSQYNMSIVHYDDVLQIIDELLPLESKLFEDFYCSKKLLEGLGMPYVKIDVCYNNCMLYWKDNEYEDKCNFCNTSRYEVDKNKVPRKILRYPPITNRLQRLYADEETTKLM